MATDPPAADLGLWLSNSCGEADANCEGALRATSIGRLCGWHAATLRPRASDRERELLQVIDAQAARLAAVEAFLQAVQRHGWDAACEVLGDPFGAVEDDHEPA